MAETTAQSTQSRHGRRTPPGLLSRLLGLPFRIVAVLVFSIISAVLIEWAGMAFQWWEQPGAEHAQDGGSGGTLGTKAFVVLL